MNPLWDYFWPALGAGAIVGVIAGIIAFRRRRQRRNAALAIGALASILLAMLWHGPLGAADRFAAKVERGVRATLVYEEIPQVSGHLHHGPLTRRVLLSGPADDFQRSELVRIIGEVPGVAKATWSGDGGGVPLIVEGAAVAVVGFLLGLLLAYLVELRRRYNAQWNW
jgi:ABC-type xylose transport system permease subunit